MHNKKPEKFGLFIFILNYKTKLNTNAATTNKPKRMAIHFVQRASTASTALALPFERNVSAPPEITPEIPFLLPS